LRPRLRPLAAAACDAARRLNRIIEGRERGWGSGRASSSSIARASAIDY